MFLTALQAPKTQQHSNDVNIMIKYSSTTSSKVYLIKGPSTVHHNSNLTPADTCTQPNYTNPIRVVRHSWSSHTVSILDCTALIQTSIKCRGRKIAVCDYRIALLLNLFLTRLFTDMTPPIYVNPSLSTTRPFT
jgi:hypothetical protein